MRNITLFVFLNNPDQTTDIIAKEQQDYLERTLTKRRRNAVSVRKIYWRRERNNRSLSAVVRRGDDSMNTTIFLELILVIVGETFN